MLMKNIYEYVYFSERQELDDFLIEKLHLDSDIEKQEAPKDEPTKRLREMWDATPERQDVEKMDYYHNKGSKPERLVATIKDRNKLLRRFGQAVRMKWTAAVKVFGQAIVDRGYYTREEVDNYIAKH